MDLAYIFGIPLFVVSLYVFVQALVFRRWQRGWRYAAIIPILVTACSVGAGFLFVLRQCCEMGSFHWTYVIPLVLCLGAGCALSLVLLLIISLCKYVVSHAGKSGLAIAGAVLIV